MLSLVAASVCHGLGLVGACGCYVDSFGADGVAGRGVADGDGSGEIAGCGWGKRDEERARLASREGIRAVVRKAEVASVINRGKREWSVRDVRQGNRLRCALDSFGLVAEVDDRWVGFGGVLAVVDGEPFLRGRLGGRDAEASYKNVAA